MASNVLVSEDMQDNSRDGYRYYLEVRTSLYHFGKFPQSLESDEEKAKLAEEVLKQQAINQTVQASNEYAMVVVPEKEVEEALNEIYDQLSENTPEDFQLEQFGLSHEILREAVELDLRIAAVFNYIAEQEAHISDTDAELFYYMHPERFMVPEKRQARHILITINDDYKENKRSHAHARINAVLEELYKDVDKFEDLAIANSECPTALEGGLLGVLSPGQLFPELDAVLFSLEEGEISPITESEMGFHILTCDSIEPQVDVVFEDVKEKIKSALRKRNQRAAQRKWLSERSKNYN